MILLSINITLISASDNETLNNHDFNNSNDDIPDIPDLIERKTHTVTSSNIGLYFENTELGKTHKGEQFIFTGDFENLGQLNINCEDVELLGNNATFKNTVVNIQSNNVTLKNLNFKCTKSISENNGAVILTCGKDINLINLSIDHVVSSENEGYAIYADGYNYEASENLKLVNSTIYFEGNNIYSNKYACAIKLSWAKSVLIENNTITTSLPLREVNYGFEGAGIDSDLVFTIGLEKCSDFIINNNIITSKVNRRSFETYPTLNCVMLSKSDNGIFTNNAIHLSDYITSPGVENYLYGLDIYNLKNLLVAYNNISIITTGGKMALGTAYPIQITGPISMVNITRNDLYSFSNGPNIGIYSQNYYGETDLSITYNKINVTGLAGSHEWALVTGIESQDTNSEISNNYIEVHSVGKVTADDNLYAISYRQSTSGSHTYNIQDNFALTDGYYAVYLLSSDNSKIINNTLVSSNKDVNTGDKSYKEGSRTHSGDEIKENYAITLIDYYKSKNNIIISPQDNSVTNTYFNGDKFSWSNVKNQNRASDNILIPYYTYDGNYKTSHDIKNDNEEIINYIDDAKSQGSINEDYENPQDSMEYVESPSNNYNSQIVEGVNSKTVANSSQNTPSFKGSDNSPSQSQSPSPAVSSKSVAKEIFMAEKNSDEEFIPSAVIVIIIMILLIIGYRRKISDQ